MSEVENNKSIGLMYSIGDTETYIKQHTATKESALNKIKDTIDANTKKKEGYIELNRLVDNFKKVSKEFSEVALNVFGLKQPEQILTSDAGSGEDYLSVTTQSTASIGSFTARIDQLATYSNLIIQNDLNEAFPDAPAIAGTLAMTVTVAGVPTLFNVSVALTDSLNEIVSKINNQFEANGLDFQAVKLKDLANDKHFIQLNSKNTGSSSLAMVWTDSGANDKMQLKSAQGGVDAISHINGVQQTTSSNTLSGVLPGVDITLKKANAALMSQAVSINYDHSEIIKTIARFTECYNQLATFIQSQSDAGAISRNPRDIYKVNTSSASPLFGSRELANARSMLDNVSGFAPGLGGSIRSLTDIGIWTERVIDKDNPTGIYHLVLKDQSKLNKALSYDFLTLKKLFATNVDITGDVGNNNSTVNFISCSKQLPYSVIAQDLTLEVTVDVAQQVTLVEVKNGLDLVATGTSVSQGNFFNISFEGTTLDGLKLLFGAGDASISLESFTINISHGIASIAAIEADALSRDDQRGGLIQIAVSNIDEQSIKLEQDKEKAQKLFDEKVAQLNKIFAQMKQMDMMAFHDISFIDAILSDGN